MPAESRTTLLASASLALATPFLAAAAIFPGTFDPIEPLSSAPAPVVTLLAAALSATAAGLTLGLRVNADVDSRKRWSRASIAPFALGAVLSWFVAASAAEPLLVGGGARTALALAAAFALPLATAVTLLRPGTATRIAWIVALVAGVALAALGGRGDLRGDELLRDAMVTAPGWGSSTLGALQLRSIRREHRLAHYRETLHAIDGTIAAQLAAHAIPARWSDDAHLVRSWLLVKQSAAPDVKQEEAAALLRDAVREDLAFAEDPDARAEPFTADGILYRDALRLADVPADDALRLRLATAWKALLLCTERVDDRPDETRAVELLLRLFEENHLDQTHPLYLETRLLQARRLVEANDAKGYLAFFDALATHPFPPELKKKIAERAAWLRAHPENDYAPAMLFLRAEVEENLEHDARPWYREIVEKYPTASVTSAAKAALAAPPGTTGAQTP
ncbi:MAG TPA: hypothetical protein VMV18_09995 [bacterium]|nr:hypothetical protein [bacterium]